VSTSVGIITVRARNTLFALGVGAFAIGSDSFIAVGIVSSIARELSVSAAIAGQMVTVFAVCYAIFAPIAASMLSNKCKKKVLLWTMILFSLGNVLCAVASGVVEIFVGRIIAALAAATFTPQATAVASSLVSPERRGAALAVVFGGMTVAGAIGAPLGIFVGQVAGWRMAFLAVAIIGSTSFALLGYLLRPVREAYPQSRLEILEPLRDAGVRMALAITYLVVLSEYVVYTYISVLFEGVKLGAMSILPIVFLVFGIGAMLGNVATGILTDRLGPRVVLTTAVIAQTTCIVAIVLCRCQVRIILPATFAWGVFSYMYLVPIQHRLLGLSKRSGAFTIALNSSVIYLAIASGAALGGAILARGPTETLLVVSLLASVLAIAATRRSFPKTYSVCSQRGTQ
jgi:MFS transporter, DHA1 family, inner membrane transport protein